MQHRCSEGAALVRITTEFLKIGGVQFIVMTLPDGSVIHRISTRPIPSETWTGIGTLLRSIHREDAHSESKEIPPLSAYHVDGTDDQCKFRPSIYRLLDTDTHRGQNAVGVAINIATTILGNSYIREDTLWSIDTTRFQNQYPELDAALQEERDDADYWERIYKMLFSEVCRRVHIHTSMDKLLGDGQ